MRSLAILLSFLTLAFGCATAPESRDARLKRFEPVADAASLYVYRDEELGAGDRMAVILDGRELGRTGARSYLHALVAPGSHKVLSKAENEDVFEFEAAAGKIYFVRQEVRLGLFGSRSKLRLVNGEEGRRGVLLCAPVGK